MKILAFAASNSTQSINKMLVTSVTKYYKATDDIIEIIDLNDFEMPLFSQDTELKDGVPMNAWAFKEKIEWADLIIISFAEHNGNYSVAYKNIIDWVSRIRGSKVYDNKKMFLLSTCRGKRGAQTVLEIAKNRMPFDGGEVLETFSLPEFEVNFIEDKGVINPLYRSQLESKIRKTKKLVNNGLKIIK